MTERKAHAMEVNLQFFKGKKVLLTGHTGFKGTWMCKILLNCGAKITGFSRCSRKEVSLFELLGLKQTINHIQGDVRDFDALNRVFDTVQPEIVFHFAAQPIVRESYQMPVYTYETNVMGTVNILECIRRHPSVKSAVVITTDKVYQNKEWSWGYRENDPLGGFDPYSNSKACAELAVNCYKQSFFDNSSIAVSTARAGNVIGGGDFAKDRIVPDCIRAFKVGKPIEVRNPHSTRPYQHVLEPLFAYLLIAQQQFEEKRYAGSYNIGPDECDCLTTGELVDRMCCIWGDNASWVNRSEENAPHEASFLKLDCSLIKSSFGWQPRWHIDECLEKTCRFSKIWLAGGNLSEEMDLEIEQYLRPVSGE